MGAVAPAAEEFRRERRFFLKVICGAILLLGFLVGLILVTETEENQVIRRLQWARVPDGEQVFVLDPDHDNWAGKAGYVAARAQDLIRIAKESGSLPNQILPLRIAVISRFSGDNAPRAKAYPPSIFVLSTADTRSDNDFLLSILAHESSHLFSPASQGAHDTKWKATCEMLVIKLFTANGKEIAQIPRFKSIEGAANFHRGFRCRE